MHNEPPTPLQESPSAPPPSRRSGYWQRRIRFAQERSGRRPTWRSDLAEELHACGRMPPNKSIDPPFAELIHFRRRLEQAATEADFAKLRRRHPALVEAVELHERNALTRWMLEARVLAGQSTTEIAHLLQLSAATVAMYEAVFFDVRDRLEAPYWVIGQAIGPRYHEKLEACRVDAVLKVFAYYCGPRMLDLLLSEVVDARGRLKPLELQNLHTPEARNTARAQIAVAAMTGPSDLKRFQELLGIQQLIRDAQHNFSSKSTVATSVSVDPMPLPTQFSGESKRAVPVSSETSGPPDMQEVSTEDSGCETGEAA